ncbi:hypothetical protein HOA97_04190 [bacterium]|jgi:hypothetical protein|nr:hypothetical protein [bacterium]
MNKDFKQYKDIMTGLPIDNILAEMEELGLIPEEKGKYNIVNEIRSYFGEEKFFEFLEYSMRVWDIKIESLK